MDVSLTINGSVKITLVPKTEVMKFPVAELIKDGATYQVSKPNNSNEENLSKLLYQFLHLNQKALNPK